MTTVQEQQSRAELSDFEAWYAKQCMRSDDAKQGLIRAWTHLAWKAARALPAGVEPVGYMIDWPDEPELGHYFAEKANDGARSQALHTAAQVQAMGRVPPGWQAVPVEPTGDMLAALSGEWHSSRHRPDRYAAMLAAAPRPPAAQERKPLTDEQISDMRGADLGALNFVTLRQFRVIARAVESAHGIKDPAHRQQT